MSGLPTATAPSAGEHIVHFYETDADLVERAGGRLAAAVRAGGTGIVIATPAHRAAFARHGELLELDAAGTLDRIRPGGALDPEAFSAVVGRVVREAAEGGRPVHAYGEMVGLLWDAGDVPGAIELETLWNGLLAEVGFSLDCGYPSRSLAGEHADALAHVCHLHSAVVAEPSWDFRAERTAPTRARRVVTEAMRRMGHT